jgi:hypothetical protein
MIRQPNLDLSPSHHHSNGKRSKIQGEGERGFLAGAKKMHSLSLWVLACSLGQGDTEHFTLLCCILSTIKEIGID